LIERDLDKCTLTIEDNGLGIPKEYQDRIFDLFFRASTQSFGSGLGLYITRNAIEKMNGQIEMVSEPGQGTTFKVTLPNNLKAYQNQTVLESKAEQA
jgi:signal transduction histidine kinase